MVNRAYMCGIGGRASRNVQYREALPDVVGGTDFVGVQGIDVDLVEEEASNGRMVDVF